MTIIPYLSLCILPRNKKVRCTLPVYSSLTQSLFVTDKNTVQQNLQFLLFIRLYVDPISSTDLLSDQRRFLLAAETSKRPRASVSCRCNRATCSAGSRPSHPWSGFFSCWFLFTVRASLSCIYPDITLKMKTLNVHVWLPPPYVDSTFNIRWLVWHLASSFRTGWDLNIINLYFQYLNLTIFTWRQIERRPNYNQMRYLFN